MNIVADAWQDQSVGWDTQPIVWSNFTSKKENISMRNWAGTCLGPSLG